MLTTNDLQKLASRPERPEKTVLTVYLDVDQSKQSNLNRGFERQLKDMLTNAKSAVCAEADLKAFETASGRVGDYVARYQPGALGLFVSFDPSDGFFVAEETDFPLQNQIQWGRQVLLQPLALAIDEYERVGIVLLDRAHLRLFTMFLGQVVEHIKEEFDHKKVRHTKTVGMDNLASGSHGQRRADEQVRLNLRHIAKDMDAMLEQRGVQRIVLAGSPEVTAELRKILPKRLDSQIIGTLNLATSASPEEIRRAVAPLAEEFERRTEGTIVTDLVTSAAKSNRAVTGLGHTLYALNQRRVWQLVYVDGFRSPGYECSGCGALFSVESAECTFCRSAVVPAEDVVGRAVDHAVRRGAKVEVVRSEGAESSLSNAGGIGAFLRTRTASELVS